MASPRPGRGLPPPPQPLLPHLAAATHHQRRQQQPRFESTNPAFTENLFRRGAVNVLPPIRAAPVRGSGGGDNMKTLPAPPLSPPSSAPPPPHLPLSSLLDADCLTWLRRCQGELQAVERGRLALQQSSSPVESPQASPPGMPPPQMLVLKTRRPPPPSLPTKAAVDNAWMAMPAKLTGPEGGDEIDVLIYKVKLVIPREPLPLIALKPSLNVGRAGAVLPRGPRRLRQPGVRLPHPGA